MSAETLEDGLRWATPAELESIHSAAWMPPSLRALAAIIDEDGDMATVVYRDDEGETHVCTCDSWGGNPHAFMSTAAMRALLSRAGDDFDATQAMRSLLSAQAWAKTWQTVGDGLTTVQAKALREMARGSGPGHWCGARKRVMHRLVDLGLVVNGGSRLVVTPDGWHALAHRRDATEAERAVSQALRVAMEAEA
jgi:hypothetical protein